MGKKKNVSVGAGPKFLLAYLPLKKITVSVPFAMLTLYVQIKVKAGGMKDKGKKNKRSCFRK